MIRHYLRKSVILEQCIKLADHLGYQLSFTFSRAYDSSTDNVTYIVRCYFDDDNEKLLASLKYENFNSVFFKELSDRLYVDFAYYISSIDGVAFKVICFY